MKYSLRGIRNRVIVISTLPLLAITAMLTLFMVSARHADLESGLETLGRSTSNNISTTAEFGMYAGDREYLNNLGRGALKDPSVRGIAFIDSQQQTLSSVGEIPLDGTLLNACKHSRLHKTESTWYFCDPITSVPTVISDYDEAFFDEASEAAEQSEQGWVILAISLKDMQSRQKEIIERSAVVSFFGMLISMLVAIRIGRGISSPVHSLTETVMELREGNLSVRAQEHGPIETQILAQGINQLASSVENSQKELELRVESATHQLKEAMKDLSERNRELESTQKDLQDAMKAKDHFLARMSHELRTPLTTVIGFTHLLNSSNLNKEQTEYSEIINHASSLLLSTIDDILDFSKLQSDALTIESIEFDLEECLEDLIAMHAYHAYGKDLELVLMIGSDVPRKLMGDPVRLKQIVNNLMGNAIKFTDKGEVILRTSLNMRVESNQTHVTLEFQVIDSGVGVSKAGSENLFQPFTQADNSITRRFGGSGLGLVICKQLVDLMGGSIDIQSTPGKGTEVTFEIPFIVSEDKQLSGPSTRLQQLQLLAYDSHPWSRRALRAQLAYWTGNIFAAGTIAQTIQLLKNQQHTFNLLVLGLNTEEMQPKVVSEILATIRTVYRGPILLLACINNVQSKIPDGILKNNAPIYCLSKPARREALAGNLELIAGEVSTTDEVQTKSIIVSKCLAGLSVLIAEDNGYNRNLIRAIIELFGATAIEAADGLAAVEIYRATPCDVVLMDVHMPNMDGIEATRQIMDLAKDNPVLVIGLTANVIENEERDLLNAGAIDILYKPVDEQKLAEKICEHTGRAMSSQHQAPSIFGNQAETVDSLKKEILRLVTDIRRLSRENSIKEAREKIHELLGLSGLFDMQKIHVHVKDLQKSVINKQYQNIEHLLTMIETEAIAFRYTP